MYSDAFDMLKNDWRQRYLLESRERSKVKARFSGIAGNQGENVWLLTSEGDVIGERQTCQRGFSEPTCCVVNFSAATEKSGPCLRRRMRKDYCY